jgi:hypothetical protein
MFYLDGPGGTGKTSLLSAILDLATLLNMDVRVVAASGVAALLLKDGQTAHSTFEIPIELEAGVECSFEPDLVLAATLNKVKLILWDEIVMMHRYTTDAKSDRRFRRFIDRAKLPSNGRANRVKSWEID